MSACCEHCEIPGEGCAYPMYGVAPHDCGPYNVIGSSKQLPREQWPENFIDDPDAVSETGKLPGCGMWWCPVCGHGRDAALRLVSREHKGES